MMKDFEAAAIFRQSENSAAVIVPALLGHAIKHPIFRRQQSALGPFPVIGRAAEIPHNLRLRSVLLQFVNATEEFGSTAGSHSKKRSIARLDHSSRRHPPIAAAVAEAA